MMSEWKGVEGLCARCVFLSFVAGMASGDLGKEGMYDLDPGWAGICFLLAWLVGLLEIPWWRFGRIALGLEYSFGHGFLTLVSCGPASRPD